MNHELPYASCTVLLFLLLLPAPAAAADVSPGDVIDKTNWQKAEGLLPEPVLDWVKKGDFILNIGEPNFEHEDVFPAFQLEAFRTNAGKYDLDEAGGIVERKSGRPANHVVGLPFPEIPGDDPRIAEKLMQNNHYMQYLPGHIRAPFRGLYLNRSGYQRESASVWLQMALTGHPGALDIENPRGVEKYAIGVVRAPYDVAGSALMTWRYLAPNKPDNSFAYSPAIRRVRRMSPANRSDSLFGTDLAIDDANGYDGKVTAFNWRLLRKQDAILPILDADPVRIVKNRQGEWETTAGIKAVVYGYEKEGWQGAAWAPTNLCWIERSVFVLEMDAKDRYYNYGPQHLWIDEKTYGCSYKVIHNKAGEYWKTLFISGAACETEDRTLRLLTLSSQQMIDDRAERSSVIEDCSPRNTWVFYAEMDVNDFSLAGFQRFCK